MKKHPAHVLQLFRPIRMTDLSFSEWVKEAIVFENGLIDCGNIEFADFLRMMWLNTPGFGGDWGKSFFGQQVDIISAVIHPGNRICSVYWMTGQAQVLAAVGHCHEAGVIIGAMEMDVPMTMLDKYVWAPVRYFVNEDPTMLNVK